MSDIKKIQERYIAAMPKVVSSAPVLKLLPSLPLTAVSPSDRVAILVGDGVHAASIKIIYAELLADGLVPCLVGSTLGQVASSDNTILDVSTFISPGCSILFKAIVIPDGICSVNKLQCSTQISEFVRQHYNLCTPILAIGTASLLLERSDVLTHLPSGLPDPTIITSTGAQLKKAVAKFKSMLPQAKVFASGKGSQIV